MATKSPAPVFEVVFSGHGIYPEKIPLGALARTLSAIQRLASGKDFEDEEELEDEAESSPRLLNVVRGSAVYRFTCPPPAAAAAVTHLRLVGQVLDDPEKVGHNDYVLNPIERLSATARALDCSIIVKQPGQGSPILARIEPKSFEAISKSLFITGETSLAGEVKRVGGATQVRCALRVPFQQRLLYCTVVNAEVARQLGDNLYRNVVVQGKASWIKGSWRVQAFKVMEVKQLKKGSLREALEALRQAGGDGWDKIADPVAFLEEVAG